MPSPTLAIIVSSVAPPTRPGIFVRTVTLALALSSIPSLATADRYPSTGALITFGYTLVSTADLTSLPAKSMAVAISKGNWIFALSDAIMAETIFSTFPPAK